MYPVALLAITLALTGTTLARAAGPHRVSFDNHRRHHARASAAARDAPPLPINLHVNAPVAKRDACTTGDWQCDGAELHHCANGEWTFEIDCRTTHKDLVCSTQADAVGCIWTWDVENTTDTDAGAPPTTASLATTIAVITDSASATASLSGAGSSTTASAASATLTTVSNLANSTSSNSTISSNSTTSTNVTSTDGDKDCEDWDLWVSAYESASSAAAAGDSTVTSSASWATSAPAATDDDDDEEDCEDEDEENSGSGESGDYDEDDGEDEEDCEDEDGETSATASHASYATASATATESDFASVTTTGYSSSLASDTYSETATESVSESETATESVTDSVSATASVTAGNDTETATTIIGGGLWADHDSASASETDSETATESASSSATKTKSKTKTKWWQWGSSSTATDSTATASATASASDDGDDYDDVTASATATASASDNDDGDYTESATDSAASSTKTGKFTKTSTAAASSTSSSSSSTYSGSWSAPHYVIYADEYLTEMPSASDLSDYNRFILAFWMVDGGAVDDVQSWAEWDSSYREQIIEEYHNAGIAIMISAFGSTDSPTTNGADAKEVAQKLAAFVKEYGLDGVDIDYEDMSAMNSAQAVSWIVELQTELRSLLPSPYIISHAPVAPWFTSGSDYSDGAYYAIHQQVGSTIDFYSVQFYNQGDDQYITCETLLTDSGSEWPSTSVFEINSYTGIELDKIVIGKPLDSGAASNGYMSPSALAKCVSQAQAKGWNGGVMFWEWSDEAPSVMATVRG